jgi:signal transduction histidine kinase
LEQLGQDETLKEDYKEYLDIIHRECRRCADIVQSLLTFSPRKSPEFCRVDLNKLFEPFFTTKPLGQGIGIGLSTCYHILQVHGGQITVDSAPGEGAVFMAILPQY